MVVIQQDNWHIALDPDNGSCFRLCRYDDMDVFAARLADVTSSFLPVISAHFPLVPFSNRIRKGQCGFEGRQIELNPNAPGEKHPLHGMGWISAWEVTDQSDNSIGLAMTHEAGEWPWRFEAKQKISVRGKKLKLCLSVTNADASAMPAGLGFHPFFNDLKTASIKFDAKGVWIPDKECLPDKWEPSGGDYDFSNGRELSDLSLDHCFTEWHGLTEIAWHNKPFKLHLNGSENLRYAALYVSQRNQCFCFEPVSHVHNALNVEHPETQGIRTLLPGETMTAEFSIEVVPKAPSF